MAKQAIGIDIGTETVKVAALKGSGRYSLVGLNYTKIPPQSWQTDALQNTDEIAKSIVEALSTAKPHRITCKDAMVAVPESVMFSTSLSLPKMSPKELASAVPLQAAEQLSLNVEECYFDWEVTGEKSAATKEPLQDIKKQPEAKAEKTAPVISGPQTIVFVVAAKKTLIDAVVETIKKAGLNPAGIDIKPAAIARAILPEKDNVSRLLVDLGYYNTGISVIHNGNPHISSTVPVGSRDFFDQVKLVMTDTGKTKLSQIFDEIVHTIRYYENRLSTSRKVTGAVLVGLGANCPDIEKIFKQETGIETIVGDPFAKLKNHKCPIEGDMQKSFADAIGLAMRRGND